ncbi:uncharacterized protein IL334_007193 [Kwoniella shivajii]|uniref:Probable RNA-binding protein 18 n=1 Tax=Kwoniella shivajii TaxID=564305 RepID=A0ABZ1D9V3_9TREE|nr:hypothetical protein IL334_007193 [Kwoniella shivajii]
MQTQPFASSSSSSLSSSHPSLASANGKPDRLYVGNLSPTVDEYSIIQIFSKYGKITKLDFMFHKSGVLKGKPRGFAFIQFTNKDDALKAMVKLHDRLLRGRKLVVTYASSAPPENLSLPTKGRRPNDPAKTTTLSLLKSSRKPQSASAQIAAMEAKLAHMKKIKPLDEDYIPGQGSSSSRNGTPGLGEDSLEGSPYPEESMLDDIELGDEEAQKAVEDLQREIDELVGDDQKSVQQNDREMTSTSMTAESNASDLIKQDLTSIDILQSKSIGLPPKPMDTSSVIPPKASSTEERSKKRQEAFNKGLAGLPKKPI